MFGDLRQQGQTARVILFAVVLVVDVVVVAVVLLDGGMLFWSEQQAQHAAEAAAIAGADVLAQLIRSDGFACGITREQLVMDQVLLYAGLNDVPDPSNPENVDVRYVTQDEHGMNTEDLRVGDSGVIPCDALVGLHVRLQFPRQTFVTSITRQSASLISAAAYAGWKQQDWCSQYALFAQDFSPGGSATVSLDGSNVRVVGGGVYSNGNLSVAEGSYLDRDYPVMVLDAAEIDGVDSHWVTTTAARPLFGEFFYTYEDFAEDGFLWEMIPADQRFVLDHDLRIEDVLVDGRLRDGLYVVEGNVALADLIAVEHPWQVTIIATGTVQIDGQVQLVPLVNGVLIYTIADPAGDESAVVLAGEMNSWAGLVVAPFGRAVVGAGENNMLNGMIAAERVRLTGANTRVYHQPAFCPPNLRDVYVLN